MKLPVNYRKTSINKRRLVREEYIKIQNNLCYYCKSSLSENPPKSILNKPIKRTLFPENFFKFPIHLHHSHETGMTIGAVHAQCNAILWQYHNE